MATRYRDAVTGEYVTKEEAEKRPRDGKGKRQASTQEAHGWQEEVALRREGFCFLAFSLDLYQRSVVV